MRRYHIKKLWGRLTAFEKKMFSLVKFDSFDDGDYFLEQYLKEKHPKEDDDFIIKKRENYVVVPDMKGSE